MHLDNDVKLDFKDVLIRPKRSVLSSRAEVDLEREYVFRHSQKSYAGVPVFAANMDGVGTFAMATALGRHGMGVALHKHYGYEDLVAFFAGLGKKHRYRVAYSMGITKEDFAKFARVRKTVGAKLDFVCVDVANGYSESFVKFIERLRKEYPDLVIMAGNVVTGEMTEELILKGVDIVKVGIGGGSVCTTREKAGVGYPQLSAIVECADAAHGLGGLVCSDGGCTNPGDVAKAFGGGADFVMLGGMLAGHAESGLPVIERQDGKFLGFYGMSSEAAMRKHSGGVAEYRASEGKEVLVKYRGEVAATAKDILGGLRSACTYVGARRLKELTKRTTFIRVTQQLNEIFGKS